MDYNVSQSRVHGATMLMPHTLCRPQGDRSSYMSAYPYDAPSQYIGNLDSALSSATTSKNLALNFHWTAQHDRLAISKFSHARTNCRKLVSSHARGKGKYIEQVGLWLDLDPKLRRPDNRVAISDMSFVYVIRQDTPIIDPSAWRSAKSTMIPSVRRGLEQWSHCGCQRIWQHVPQILEPAKAMRLSFPRFIALESVL